MVDFDPAKLKLEPKFEAELLRARPKGDTSLQKKRAKPAPNKFVRVPWLWGTALLKPGLAPTHGLSRFFYCTRHGAPKPAW
jgi:hypothetical protein